ncbi:MAG: hypothetical protein JSS02_18965 [Planctomycetes bacterium]|nr:hypothetical protein [Planctomycetota bacterium]
MMDLLVSLVFGTALILGGGALFRWHRAQWSEHRGNATLSDREKSFYRTQFRRRLQVAVLLMLLGLFVPVLDYMSTNSSARAFTVMASGLLLLTFWVMLLAALDWLSLRVFRRAMNSRQLNLNRLRRELEAEADRLRRGTSNGEPHE